MNKDVTYLNNAGAAKFEKGDYQGAIEVCQKAVDEGRDLRADFKIVAKSYARIGSAYEKLGDLTKAIESYNNSLMEHRTPDALAKLRNAEKIKDKAEKDAYLDPEEAEKARMLGQEKYKEADWPAAVDAFTEMIKRAPNDPRGYSNRAAALIKLMAFPGAVQDCNEAIKPRPQVLPRVHAQGSGSDCDEGIQPRSGHLHRGRGAGRRYQRPRDRAATAEVSGCAVQRPRWRD